MLVVFSISHTHIQITFFHWLFIKGIVQNQLSCNNTGLPKFCVIIVFAIRARKSLTHWNLDRILLQNIVMLLTDIAKIMRRNIQYRGENMFWIVTKERRSEFRSYTMWPTNFVYDDIKRIEDTDYCFYNWDTLSIL